MWKKTRMNIMGMNMGMERGWAKRVRGRGEGRWFHWDRF